MTQEELHQAYADALISFMQEQAKTYSMLSIKGVSRFSKQLEAEERALEGYRSARANYAASIQTDPAIGPGPAMVVVSPGGLHALPGEGPEIARD